MTRATALALAAAALAAGGLVELLGALAGARRDPGRSRFGLVRALAGIARLGRAVGARRASAGLARRLELAGLTPRISVSEAMAVKVGMAVLGLGVVPLLGAVPTRARLALLLMAPVGGFLGPDLLIARRIRARAYAMGRELPELLDLLYVAVGAGMTPLRALGEVGRRRRGPLAIELVAAAGRIELGVHRRPALDALARRCPLDGVAALVSAVERSERHGAPLAPALAALALEARARRAQALREQAARAGPKIQLVIALLLVPAVLLLVAAAIVAGLR